jgi:diguanylate cyclase (GGDEF)-like protein
MVFCIPVFLWAFLIAAGTFFGFENDPGTIFRVGIVSANILIPVLLMFHIWSQVSFRPITAAVRFFWLLVPIALIAIEAFGLYEPEFDINYVLYGNVTVVSLISSFYYIIVIVKSYLLCFNVFYQMPKHMRNSTYQMLVAISAMLVAEVIVLYFSVPEYIGKVALAVSYIIAVSTLYKAFFIANSSNVIVTSRDFVFSNLSTLVITVSLKGNILDWNRKGKGACLPLPDPKYKEPYSLYRKRIIEESGAATSPYDDEIINISSEAGEHHFMFSWHEICHQNRKFGYIVEVAEVTASYSKIRYVEAIAYFDNLTSLHNRNAYIEKVKGISIEENMPLLIIVGDVNNLKKINDTLGHLMGDKLLLIITDAVKKNAPERAFVARIGGDELALLIPNATDTDAMAFIEAVTQALNIAKDPDIGTPSISWGFSTMYNTSENYNDVFYAADAIMYETKQKTKEVSISGIIPQENISNEVK